MARILRKTRAITFGLTSILSIIVLALPAFADTAADDQWHFQLAPYAWLSGQKGDLATQKGFPASSVDIDFWDDILGNINGALFLVGEAQKKNFGIVTDIAYTDIEDNNATPGPAYSNLSSRTKTWMISASGFYRLVRNERSFLDAFMGVRYWSVDSTLDFSGGVLPPARLSNREDWFDPMVGLKGLVPFGSSRFFASGAFSVGGFGLGSDIMWDAMLNLGYQWTKTFSTTIGYRYLDVDYENDGFIYDVAQQGLTLGLSWRF